MGSTSRTPRRRSRSRARSSPWVLAGIEEGKRIPPDVKVGDKVLYGKYSGTEVTIDGEQVLILRESDVLAVIG